MDQIGDIIAQYEGECEQMNRGESETYSDYEVQDDGGEGAYIMPFAAFIAK